MRIWNGRWGHVKPPDSAEGKPKILRVMIQSCLAHGSFVRLNQSTNMTLSLSRTLTHTHTHVCSRARWQGTGRRSGGLTPHSHTHTPNFLKPVALLSCLFRPAQGGVNGKSWLGSTPRQRLGGAFGFSDTHTAPCEARRSHSSRSELHAPSENRLIIVVSTGAFVASKTIMIYPYPTNQPLDYNDCRSVGPNRHKPSHL